MFRGGVPAVVLGGHLVELLVDLTDTFAGFGELRGLGEWLVDVFSGVGDLAACSFDVSEGFSLAGFKAVEAVLQPGDQAGRVGGAQVTGRDLEGAARHAVEDDGDVRLAKGPLDSSHEGEAAERTWVRSAYAQAIKPSYLAF
jgi:hypothetical protein